MERAELAAANQPIRLRDNYKAAVIVLAVRRNASLHHAHSKRSQVSFRA